MKLKKLVITGFKSFADKVTLLFDDGITGIVGPNGSGKSNVIDAVRWVMGEQSAKHLRGQVATDIIFAGSDKRKSVGMAEVTLVFDNSDFSELCPPEYRQEAEIALSRRLYADGQREYYINRKPCRLKDIVGFFTLTGLGGRSYSMIQQGQVDRILNAKPEDVRLILEEAAGTISFKTRQEAAQKKLVATQDNLARIEDIASELERQLEGLKEQVTKAKQYKELKTQLEDHESKLLVYNFRSAFKKYQELNEELSSQESTEAGLLAKISTAEAMLTTLQNRLAEADPELEVLREQLSSLREGIVRSESEITAAFVAIENGERRLEELLEQVDKDRSHVHELETIVSQAQKEAEILADKQAEFKEQLEALEDDLERADEAANVFRNREDQIKDDLKNLELLLESNALRTEATARDRKKTLEAVSQFDERLKTIERDVADCSEKLKEKEHEKDHLDHDLNQIIHKKVEIEDELRSLNQKLEVQNQEVSELENQLIRVATKKSSLEELLKNSCDLKEVWSELEKKEPSLQSLHEGILSEQITLIADHPLSKAAVAALEAYCERLVLKGVDELKQLVEVMATHDSARIPISFLKEASFKKEEWAQNPSLKPLSSYVKVNHEPLQAIIERIFYIEGTQFPESAQGAIFINDSGVVTLSSHDGVLERKDAKGRFVRLSEIEELTQRGDSLTTQLEEKKAKVSLLSDKKKELTEALSELEQELKSQNEASLTILRDFQKARQEYDYKQQLLKDVMDQKHHSETSLEIFTQELEELSEARISIGRERDELHDEKSGLQDEAYSVIDTADEVRRQFDAKKMELAQLEAKAHAKAESLHHYLQQLTRLKEHFDHRGQEKERVCEDIAKAKTVEKELAERIQDQIAKRGRLEEELETHRSKNSALVDEIRQIEVTLKEYRGELNRLQKNRSGFDLEVERLKLAMEGAKQSAVEKYQFDVEQYELDLPEDFQPNDASGRIKKIKAELDGLGAINMMAIEEYDKLSTRFEFITSQKVEVESSIALLEEAICEIQETAREKFLEVFQEIDKNFSELFPILFPGGDARLHLTQEDDPLNGGVDILVRLPGKKQRSMTLFSGGEKALTAISLIFALLKTKPTPFCFLDEVDAPLDEANVGRYNNVLQFLSERFQFVVITHNRRTMEVLDQLYGVTMPEGGVSKVVGVDLRKDLPAHLKKAFKEESKEAR